MHHIIAYHGREAGSWQLLRRRLAALPEPEEPWAAARDTDTDAPIPFSHMSHVSCPCSCSSVFLRPSPSPSPSSTCISILLKVHAQLSSAIEPLSAPLRDSRSQRSSDFRRLILTVYRPLEDESHEIQIPDRSLSLSTLEFGLSTVSSVTQLGPTTPPPSQLQISTTTDSIDTRY